MSLIQKYNNKINFDLKLKPITHLSMDMVARNTSHFNFEVFISIKAIAGFHLLRKKLKFIYLFEKPLNFRFRKLALEYIFGDYVKNYKILLC